MKIKKTINGLRQNIGTEFEQQTSEKLRSEQAAHLPNLSFLQAFYLSDLSAAFWLQVSKASLGA